MQQKGLKPAAKIVLYWIADHHNSETGACFPSLSVLADECEMDRATVIRHITALSEFGLIQKVERNRNNGSRTSNGYQLLLEIKLMIKTANCFSFVGICFDMFCNLSKQTKWRLGTNRRSVLFAACELRSETISWKKQKSVYNQPSLKLNSGKFCFWDWTH